MISLSFRELLYSRRQETSRSSTNIYHYTRENDHEKSRIHLRVDPDGSGTLIVNANRVMHLNPTAAFMAYLLLEGKREHEIVPTIRNRYRVSAKQAGEDLATFNLQLDNLLRPDGD